MAQFKVSSDALNDTSSQLSSGALQLQDQLSILRAKVVALGGDWDGAGSQAFNQLYEEFNKAGADLNEALTGIATMLSKAAGFYAESEANVASAFNAR